MTSVNNKVSTTENERRFYPDYSELCWQYIIFTAIIAGLILLLFMAVQAKDEREILFMLFFMTSAYVSYIGYFMCNTPKLYIDEKQTYIRFISPIKNEIINIKDICSYDYFNCYKSPLKYPFLCLCVRLFLHNGKKVEFFAFMKGAQGIIEDKMSSLGIKQKF